MLKTLFVCLALTAASFGCATAPRNFEPMGNCVPAFTEAMGFSCVDASGKPFPMLFQNARDLMCFDTKDFKAHEEVCHQK